MTGTKPTTPVARYFHQEAQRRGYVLDAAQGNAILHLDRLAERLRRGPSLFRQAPRSLYLWGAGRARQELADGWLLSQRRFAGPAPDAFPCVLSPAS
ncbi:cell division protein ZapE [Pseudomonas aeruginosa]|nr:cell division protein ZapE [Pseudomonas aeruginosa]MDV6600394.1 cell division protein ZapE [Pseudomonas aeruginosa]